MNPSEPFDPYAELQLSPDAEPELIKAAFKALAKKYHPDKFTDPVEKKRAEEKMARINEAQQMLVSGTYRTPPSPQPKPDPSPPPSRPNPRPSPQPRPKGKPQLDFKVEHFLAAVLVVIALVALPGLFAEDNLQKALKFEKEGRLQDSLTYLNDAVKEDPHDRELYRHRARIWEKLGEPEKAAIDLKNAKIPELAFPSPDPSPEPTPESAPNQVTEPSVENSGPHVP